MKATINYENSKKVIRVSDEFTQTTPTFAQGRRKEVTFQEKLKTIMIGDGSNPRNIVVENEGKVVATVENEKYTQRNKDNKDINTNSLRETKKSLKHQHKHHNFNSKYNSFQTIKH